MKREIPDKVIQALGMDDLEIKSIDEEKRIIWHKITKEVRDRMGDIVRIDGIDLKKFKKKPGVLDSHNYWGGNPPPVIAEGIGFKTEGKALYAGTKFFDPADEKMSQQLRDLSGDHFALHKMKLMGWSIGFIPKVTETVKDKDGNFQGYDFKESELLEYSSVIIPANQEAINDAFTKGLITKEFAENLKHVGDKLPGEVAEEVLTQNDIGKIEEESVVAAIEVAALGANQIATIKAQPEKVEVVPDEKPEEPEEEESIQQGVSPEIINQLSAVIDSLLEKRKKLKEILENLKRR